jgi:hypothetical protein
MRNTLAAFKCHGTGFLHNEVAQQYSFGPLDVLTVTLGITAPARCRGASFAVLTAIGVVRFVITRKRSPLPKVLRMVLAKLIGFWSNGGSVSRPNSAGTGSHDIRK